MSLQFVYYTDFRVDEVKEKGLYGLEFNHNKSLIDSLFIL